MEPRGAARRLAGGAARTLLAVAPVLGPVAAEACAACIGGGSEGAGLNPGFYWSAVVLTALPFVAVVVAGAWLHRQLSATGRDPVQGPAPGPKSRGGSAGPGGTPAAWRRPGEGP